MRITSGRYEVTLIDEPIYSLRSVDNPRSYLREYCRDKKYHHACAHGINVVEDKALLSSAVLIGIGGATGVHENSIVLDGSSLYVATGDALYSLSLPTLELNWCQQVDLAACFEVFLLPNRDCLLTCGELEISCYSKVGEKLWGFCGGDIFTGEIEIKNNIAKVSDFIGDIYEIELSNGKIVNIENK